MLIALTIVWILLLYFGAGILFALFFVIAGIAQIDAAAKHSAWGFRVLIFPGAIALWPLLLSRVIKGNSHPPIERNAHRKLACTK